MQLPPSVLRDPFGGGFNEATRDDEENWWQEDEEHAPRLYEGEDLLVYREER